MTRRTRQRGFTLLEVLIAIGILGLFGMILLEGQASSVLQVHRAEKLDIAATLADEKMREVLLTVEREGWSTQDVAETGDFTNFGEEEFRGDALQVDLSDELSQYSWAYTVRAIELNLPDQSVDGLMQGGDVAEAAAEQNVTGLPTLADLGIDASVIGEYIEGYVREVRVLVWWGDNLDGMDQVELVHHVIDPSGMSGGSASAGGT